MKTTALHDKHTALGAKMVDFAGFDMPVSYGTITEEHRAVREAVGLFDVSHMGEFFVHGPQARPFLQYATSNDVDKLFPGRVQYSTLPNDRGGLIDDLLVYCLDEEEFMTVVNAANLEKDWQRFNRLTEGYEVQLDNQSDHMSLLAVQGPKAKSLLQELTATPLDEIAFYHFTKGEVAGYANVIISNTGYTGSGGFELYLPNEQAPGVWDALMEQGQAYGIKPCGLGARDTLRLEAGLGLYGNDLSESTSPFEARLGWVTKLKTGFAGSEEMARQKESGVQRKLVGFELKEKGVPRHDYPIYDESGEHEIGIVTSGTQSPMTKKSIGMGFVETAHAEPGTSIRIGIRKKQPLAEVVKLPFYKPE